jgi:hypothetical protein
MWNDWDSRAKEVKDQEGILQEFEKLREYVWFQEECNRKQQQVVQYWNVFMTFSISVFGPELLLL